jgi:transposase
VVGLVLGREGFPSAHEVFDGNRSDVTTVDEMLTALEVRVGKNAGGTIVVDRGMASEDNLKLIKARGYHYIVASRKEKLSEHFDEFTDEEGWQELVREVSPRNTFQKKSRVQIKQSRESTTGEVRILCIGEQRIEKDRAIREAHEKRLIADLKKLQKRIEQKQLLNEKKIWECIGRLKERYSRVARYYSIDFDAQNQHLLWHEDSALKEKAAKLDGGYLLRTDRQDLSEDEVWRTYMLLTRVESAFKDMKSPLMERPIFHQLQKRVQTHIFLCVLAYHLLVAIEKMFHDYGQHTSWETLRKQLSTHHTATVVLPTKSGRTLTIRKGTRPDPTHREIYRILQVPDDVMKPVKIWA